MSSVSRKKEDNEKKWQKEKLVFSYIRHVLECLGEKHGREKVDGRVFCCACVQKKRKTTLH